MSCLFDSLNHFIGEGSYEIRQKICDLNGSYNKYNIFFTITKFHSNNLLTPVSI